MSREQRVGLWSTLLGVLLAVAVVGAFWLYVTLGGVE